MNHQRLTMIPFQAQKEYLYVKPTENKVNITIFSVPKPFSGLIGTIQRNAILSWSKLKLASQIILFGDEEGTGALCQELGICHVPEVTLNEYGTPMLDGIFAEVEKQANSEIVAYVNADIILMNDFTEAITAVSEELDKFLMIGRRWNIDLFKELSFAANWEESLRSLVGKQGCLAPHDAKDYFVFPKHLYAKIPPFAVGRGYWDNWMVNEALNRGYPLVDASLAVLAVHQEHTYIHVQGGKNEAYMGKEAQRNKTAGNVNGRGTISEANWQLKTWQWKNLPTVSVIITSKSAGQELTVASILSETYADYEIIVADDGVGKESEPGKIRYFPGEKLGVLAAGNYGLKLARGEFVLFLNADCLLLPGALAAQVACFAAEASTLDLVLSSWQLNPKEKSARDGGAMVEPWKYLPDLEDVHIWKLWQLWQPLSNSQIMYRRDRLNLIGGFDTRLEPQAAMVDVVLRLIALKGCRAKWLREPTCNCLKNNFNHNLEPMKIAQDAEKVIDNFFSGAEVKEWMRLLEDRARLTTMEWLAWLMYSHKKFTEMSNYINKSLKYIPAEKPLPAWQEQLQKFS
ncbi:MAG: glycosyltransferase family 2 protein [Gomphosphaeria aponina SAG 52.96 = DSM 107014]|uniref:Glycosyltransferase family 2 protein n=1 Tax=Gomphosphaeria aponina SAG 52.96 = DSM 107014 TaxID=1521640 RepID=A0A941GPS9_9CHRO|nr:glycosyltransferase family 2 protein [Gomphosphaeria aponina SAG 52.96 = DSM 107014]